MTILGLDHLVLTVRSIDQTIDFYEKLGMKAVTFGIGRKALQFGDQKINLHERGKEFQPKAHAPTPGSADLCFWTDAAIEDVMQRLIGEGLTIIEGPIERTGAISKLRSIYIRDPDQNLIEISNRLTA